MSSCFSRLPWKNHSGEENWALGKLCSTCELIFDAWFPDDVCQKQIEKHMFLLIGDLLIIVSYNKSRTAAAELTVCVCV